MNLFIKILLTIFLFSTFITFGIAICYNEAKYGNIKFLKFKKILFYGLINGIIIFILEFIFFILNYIWEW
jgi:hypothetical protein